MKVSDYFDLGGGLGRSVHPQEAMEKAAEMRAVLTMDAEEEVIAAAVQRFDVGDMDMQIAAWTHLNAGEQRAWRAFRGMRVHQD